MTQVTLLSDANRPLRPLIEGALANELRLIEAGIQRTQQRLLEFERQYQMPTEDFLRHYEANQLGETLDYAEWIGEYRLLQRQREKAEALRGIRIAD